MPQYRYIYYSLKLSPTTKVTINTTVNFVRAATVDMHEQFSQWLE